MPRPRGRPRKYPRPEDNPSTNPSQENNQQNTGPKPEKKKRIFTDTMDPRQKRAFLEYILTADYAFRYGAAARTCGCTRKALDEALLTDKKFHDTVQDIELMWVEELHHEAYMKSKDAPATSLERITFLKAYMMRFKKADEPDKPVVIDQRVVDILRGVTPVSEERKNPFDISEDNASD